MEQRKLILFLFAAIVLMTFSSCATICAGGDPSITINGQVDEPVTIKTEKQTYLQVMLPAVVQVDKHKLKGQQIHIESEHYLFNDLFLDKQVNGWTFANIIIGGFVGWGVDLITNCVVRPKQTQFTIYPIVKNKVE